MKTKLIAITLCFLIAGAAFAAPPKGKTYVPRASAVDNETYIDANNILMFVTNHGNFARDLSGVFGKDAGTFYPYNTPAEIRSGVLDDWVVYASGLWVGGKVNGQTRVAIAEYDDEYVPGPMENGTFIPDNGSFRVYKLYRDSLAANPNADYLNWPVSQGAPVDSTGAPAMQGDQMLWAVYNDADPEQHGNDAGNTAPLGIEIQQSTFAFDGPGVLGNIIFLRYKVLNKGSNTIENCYLSLWSDPDLGDAGDDFVGCDTLQGLGFVYNSDNDDGGHYGDRCPAVGYDFFQGPVVPGDPTDTALAWGDTLPGFKNLGMVSFNKYINGTDPNNFDETYNYMQGLQPNGDPYTYNGNPLLYYHSGDPVTGTGDLDVTPADRRFMQSTGPITFAPGDSVEIVAAIIVGQGTDNLNSIEVMRAIDVFAQDLYPEFLPPRAPARPIVTVAQLDGAITLSWGDTSEVDQGDYPFEGYTVYQGETPTGPWKELKSFDLINDVTLMIDTLKDPVSGATELPQTVKYVQNSGLGYKYIARNDVIGGGPLLNVKEYHFRVDAFSYSDTALAGFKVLEAPTVVSVRPQSPGAGDNVPYELEADLAVDHVGPSDGSVTPVVVDPTSTLEADYRVVFEDTPGGTVWHLIRGANDTVLANQTNQAGDDAYFVAEGIQVIVAGPEAGVKPGDMFASDDQTTWGWDIPNGTRRFTWAGADGFGFEGFRGALGWGGPSDTHGFGSYEPIPPNMHVSVLLKLADVTVDTVGYFDCTTFIAENDPEAPTCSLYATLDIDTFTVLQGLPNDSAYTAVFDSLVAAGVIDSIVTDGFFDPNQEDVSYAYRYGRNFQLAPAKPEFAPYIINTAATYDYQDFEKSVPLSAWNVDVNPPERLAVGFLENNVAGGLVDGKYWPGSSDFYDNTSSSGPREWLFIFLAPYSETADPQWQANGTADSLGVLYWALWNRRGDVPFASGDEFQIFPARVNTPADTFSFNTAALTTTQSENALARIKTVPNPFYLYGPYEADVQDKQVKFINLPNECTIDIYNIAGDLVATVVHDETDPDPTIATWNTLTSNNLPVASGIYIYVVTAPGFGQKIGKMAIFTEVEVLPQF